MKYRIEEALDAAFTANWFVWDNDLFVAAFSSQKDAQLFVWAKQMQAMALPMAPAEDIEATKAAENDTGHVFNKYGMCMCGVHANEGPPYCGRCPLKPSPFAQKLADLVHQTSPYYSPPEDFLATADNLPKSELPVDDPPDSYVAGRLEAVEESLNRYFFAVGTGMDANTVEAVKDEVKRRMGALRMAVFGGDGGVSFLELPQPDIMIDTGGEG